MNIPGLLNKYSGQTLSYDGIPANAGQCAQWSEYVLTDSQYGYGLAPFWGNAIDWWNNFSGSLAQGFVKVPISQDKPKAGDFVIWGSGVGSVYGHIDLCTQDWNGSTFTGYDSNWGGNKTVHAVQHNLTAVIGMLRPKGQPQVDDMVKPTAQQVFDYFHKFLQGTEPTQEQVDYYVARDIRDLYSDILNAGLIPKEADIRQAFKDLAPELPGPNNDQVAYYQGHDWSWLYKDLAYYETLKAYNDANSKAIDLDKSVQTLTSENATLRQKLAEEDSQIKDPNKIIITNKGWSALWAAAKSFFEKNN